MENWLKNLSTKSRKYDTLKTIFEIINEMNRVLMKKKISMIDISLLHRWIFTIVHSNIY